MTGMLTIKDYVKKEKEVLKEKIKKQRDNNLLITPPVLNIVQVGNVEASNRYVRNKVKDCEEVGIDAKVHHLPEGITTYELASFVDNLWGPTIVQLPLPEGVKAPMIKP
jgi:methylenetetrahydrofolate dehydrogenase (NADP+)/methenyltetrahydrofolate cyclohydrolase